MSNKLITKILDLCKDENLDLTGFELNTEGSNTFINIELMKNDIKKDFIRVSNINS